MSQPHDPDRPTLVFVHGAGGCGLQWNYQVVYFRKLGYRVLAVDLPGHGKAPGPGRQSITDYADALKAILVREAVTRVVLIGHSMGGGIVLTEALRKSPLCMGLVLASTGAKLRVRPDLLEALRDHPEQAPVPIVKASYAANTDEAVLRRAEIQVRGVDPQVLYGDFLASDRFDVRDELETISVPTLIVVGIHDELTPVRYSEYFRAHIPNSDLEVITDSGHMVMLEQPTKFNEVLEHFLKHHSWHQAP
jgi:pimeloyl-ACP methyl ester carboxylesterase